MSAAPKQSAKSECRSVATGPEPQRNVNTHQTLGAPPEKTNKKALTHIYVCIQIHTTQRKDSASDRDKTTLSHIADVHRDVAGIDVVLLALEHHSASIIWRESRAAPREGHNRAFPAPQAQPIKFHEMPQRRAPN